MEQHVPNRTETLSLLQKYTTSEALINHAKAVESVMCYMAEKFGENIEKWGIIGLVHDLDYEKFPDEHCRKVKEILVENGWHEDYIRAVVSHGWGICTDVKPETLLEKTLYTIDELTGLVTACALVRPSRSVTDLEAKSVMKKWKQPSFAGGVNRDVIVKGAEMLGMNLNDLFTEVILGMRRVAREIGL